MKTISLDFETRSTVDLRRSGAYPYAADTTTEVLCMAYAVDNMEPMLWVPGDPVPGDIIDAASDPDVSFRAWNANFERLIWANIMAQLHGFPHLADERWVCTMAEAAAMALPRGLGKCAKVLKCDHQKDDGGHRLMLQMSKPRRPRKGEDPDGVYYFEDAPRLNRLYSYCLDDVRTERDVARKLRRLGDHERSIYLLDQSINDRGVHLDLPLIHAARRLRDRAVAEASAEMSELTDGMVRGVTDARGLRAYLGVDSVAEQAVREMLEEDYLDDTQRRVLQLRAENGKSSVAKLDTMLNVVMDGAARGLLQYHGADTGRWAGRLIQPQNFPRPSIKDIESFIPLVLAEDYDAIVERAPIMEVLSSMLRYMLIPAPGRTFYCADFSAIEGWVVAWLAGQDGMTSYEEMAAAIYGMAVEDVGEESEERQVGKVAVLGCGYGMGWKKYRDTVKAWTGLEISEELAERAVNTYRSVNQQIRDYWYEVEDAALAAVRTPGLVGRAGRIKYRVKGPYLWCVLPSGRPLCYPLPRLVDTITPWGATKEAVEISTTNSYTRKWERRTVYGGLLVENITQAVARDVMADAMLRVEAAGYPITLTVHDEVLAESAAGDLAEFQQLMSEMPEWADGLTLKVSGWKGERYRK